MTHGELEIPAYVRVMAHYIHILDSLAFPRLSVDAWLRFGPRAERPVNIGDSNALLGG